MKFYRYEIYQTSLFAGFPMTDVKLMNFNLHKETPKGYWIGYGFYAPDMLRGNSRWVSKDGRKRYAYPTKEEAMVNFVKRTEKRIKILKAQLHATESGLAIAQKLNTIENNT